MSEANSRMFRTALIVAGSGFALIAALLWRPSPATEPSYDGHRLTWWLNLASSGSPDEAEHAIMALGTNSLPFLIKGLRCRDTAMAGIAYGLADRVGLHLTVSSGLQRRILSYVGFKVLGPVGNPAIPDLLSLAGDTNTSSLASESLAAVGPEGVRALCSVLTNTDWRVRHDAVVGLGDALQSKDVALDAVARATKDPNFMVRWACARAIGRLNADPTRSLPALIAITNDTNRVVRAAALEALGSFGPSARQAVEVVRRATNDTELVVRSAAYSALARIGKGSVQ